MDIFNRYQFVDWIVGNSTTISDLDHLIESNPPRPHSRIRFLMGDIRWVQQESTFWRRSLWEKSGNRLETGLNLAVDFELWMRFFRHAKLYGVNVGLGAFRMRSGQRSHTFIDEYLLEVETVIHKERASLSEEFFQQHRDLLQLPFMMRRKHQADEFGTEVLSYDAPMIEFDRNKNDWSIPDEPVILPLESSDPSKPEVASENSVLKFSA